jgi:integrase
VSEVANLKASDIDSERMTLRVEQGKGQRDRYVMLSPQLLELLRDWWRAARPQVWLFPGQNPINPITSRQLNRAVTTAKDLSKHNSGDRDAKASPGHAPSHRLAGPSRRLATATVVSKCGNLHHRAAYCEIERPALSPPRVPR